MASYVDGYIGKIDPGNGTEYAIGSTAYGECSTAASTANKVVDMTGFVLIDGATIHVTFDHENTASSPTLNVNSTGAITIKDDYPYWDELDTVSFTYDGSNWRINRAPNKSNIVKVTWQRITSLPTTLNNSNITSKHVVLHYVIDSPQAQTGDWTVVTMDGSVTLSGTIAEPAAVELILGPTM